MMQNAEDWMFKWGLYAQSLSLLFILIIIETLHLPEICSVSMESICGCIKENSIALVCMIGLMVASVSYLYFLYWSRGSDDCSDPQLTEVREVNADILGFLMTTIVPLATLMVSPERRLYILLVILYAIGKMSVDSSLLATNPTLLLLGYKIYRVKTSDLKERIFITKDLVKVGDRIEFREVNNAVISGGKVGDDE